jgi:YVTN family beta-propeller protein
LIYAMSRATLLTIPIARGDVTPVGVAGAPDGRHAYVASGRANSVAVIDVPRMAITATIAVGQRPWGIAVARDGRRVFTANGMSNDLSIIDANTSKVVATIKVGQRPWGIALVP